MLPKKAYKITVCVPRIERVGDHDHTRYFDVGGKIYLDLDKARKECDKLQRLVNSPGNPNHKNFDNKLAKAMSKLRELPPFSEDRSIHLRAMHTFRFYVESFDLVD